MKHTALKPPGGTRYIRLSSLGEGYSEEEIKKRLAMIRTGAAVPEKDEDIPKAPPRRYTVKNWSRRQQRPKLKGFRRLYVYYLFFLGYRKPGRKRKSIPFAVRKEVTKLHRYQKQFRFLQEYRIDDAGQLSMLGSALQTDIDVMADQRKELYRQKQQGQDVTAQIEAVNQAIRQRRQKLKLCEQIETDIPRIREQVRQSREPEQQPEKQTKQSKKFSIYERGN